MAEGKGKAQVVLSAVDQTRAAFDSAKRNIDGLKRAGDGLALKFGTIGTAIAGAFAAVSMKHLIDAADDIGKLSQKTGIAVESLTALKYAGELSDVSIEDLAGGLKKLAVNMAAAAGGSKDQQAAFDAIGVSVKNAAGNLRNTDDVLGDVAERFASFADGPEKAALAVALFGKTGDQLIPFLNSGRRGLAEMRDEAQKLGVVFGSDLARQAEAFNDNLSRVQTALNGLKVSVLPGVLEKLNELILQLIEGRKAFGSFSGALFELGIRSPAYSSYGEGAKAAREELERLNAQLDQLRNKKPPPVVEGPGGAAFTGPRLPSRASPDAERQLQERIDRAERRLKYFNALQAQDALAGSTDVQDERRFQTDPAKPAPIIPKATTSNADALLRKELEGRLQALRKSLEAERDAFQFANAQLANAFAAGELSIDQFYDAKAKAQQEFLAKQDAGFKAEIKALEAYKAKVKGKPEEVEADTKIQAMLAEQAEAHREAGQAAKEGEEQRKRATEDFRRSLVELDAQLRELSGDHYGAELLRNAQKMAEARALLARGGGDPKRLAELDALLKRQADYNRLNEQLALLTERQAVAEEAYIVTARARGTGLLEQERGILAIRQRSVEQLQVMADKAQALARANPTEQGLVLWAEQLALALQKAREQMDPTLERVRAATDEFGDGIAHAVEDVLVDFQSLNEAFDNIGKMLQRLVFQTLVTDPLRTSLKGWLGQLAPSITGFITGGASTTAGGAAGAAGAAATAATQAATQQAAAAGLTAVGTAATGASTALGSLGVSAPAVDFALAGLVGTVPATDLALVTLADSAFSAALALQAAAAVAGSSGAGGAVGGVMSLFAHSGGVVGQGGHYRSVSFDAFEGAFRYRRGGIAGLAPDEVPAVLHRGEEVLTQADPRHRDNGGVRAGKVINVAVNVSNAPGMTKQSATQMGAAAGRAARAALARND